MPISTYNGTNPSSASGYFRRYFSEFKDARGVAYRLEILDSQTTSTGFPFSNSSPAEFMLGRDGVTIDWDGADDDLHDPIISSTLTADFLLEGSHHWAFPSVLAGASEDRFAVALFHLELDATSTTASPSGKWRPEWFGVLIPEGVEYVANESNEFLRITASDGLATLNEIPYSKADGSAHTSLRDLGKHLSDVFENLPTASLWSFDSDGGTTAVSNTATLPVEFLTEVQFIQTKQTAEFTTNVPDSLSVLKNIGAQGAAFYQISSDKDALGGRFHALEVVSCGKVLKEIASCLGARVFQSSGRFWFVHWGAFDDRTARLHHFRNPGHLSSKAHDTVSTVTSDGVFDLDSNDFKALKGLSTRYLFPVKEAVSVHEKGGSRILLAPFMFQNLLGDLGQYYEDRYPIKFSNESGINAIQEDADIVGGSSPVVSGSVYTVTGILPGETADLDHVGMWTLLKFTIKVGDYYLNRDLALSSTTIEIQRDLASNLDQKHYAQTGDVTWTTTPSTYDLAVPFIGMEGGTQPAVIVESDGDEFVGGIHTEVHSDGERFRYDSTFSGGGSSHNYGVSFDMNWSLPPTPDAVALHNGIEFQVVAEYRDRSGNDVTAAINTATSGVLAGNIGEFAIFTSAQHEETDVTFVATNTGNRARIDVASSILGDQYLTDVNPPGGLRHRKISDGTFFESTTSTTWTAVDDITRFDYLHSTLATHGAKERETILRTISGTFAHDPAHSVGHYEGSDIATPNAVPGFQNLLKYTIGATSSFYALFSMSWSVRASAFDVSGFLVDVDRATLPASNDDAGDRTARDFGGSEPAEVFGSRGLSRALIDARVEAAGSSGSLSADDQAKLAAITLSGSQISDFNVTGTVLTSDEIEDASSSHKFATSSQLNTIAANASAIGDIQTVFKETTTGDGAGVYVNTAATDESHVSVTSTAGKLQAGARTSLDLTETSPGTIALNVQSGATGSEAQVTAIQITGSSTDSTKATVSVPSGDFRVSSPSQFSNSVTFSGATNTITFTAATSGIDYSDLTGTPTLPTPLASGDQTLTGNRVVNVDGNYLQFKNGTNVRLQYDPNDDRFEFSNGLHVSGDLVTTTGGMTSGLIKFQEPAMGGTNGVILKGPTTNLTSDVTFVLPDADGTSGQVLQTDGSGNLSFTDQSGGGGSSLIILANISGRFQFSSTDSGERMWTGQGSYGPFNWYSFTSEPGTTMRTYSASDAVGTKTGVMNHWQLMAYGIHVPTSDKKVRVDFMMRIQNAPANSTWGFSLWGANRTTSGTTTTNITTTLRGIASDVTAVDNNSTRLYHGNFETDADFTEDVVILMPENRTGTLTTTTYLLCNFQLSLVD